MNKDEREKFFKEQEEKLLIGGTVFSEWCTFISKSVYGAFINGADLATMITALAYIETYFRTEDAFSEKKNLCMLIDEYPFLDSYERTQLNIINNSATTTGISSILVRTYKTLDISEILKKQIVGKKNLYIYPPGSFKKTSMVTLLENGTNIVYLKKLTGLDMSTLVGDIDFESNSKLIDVQTADINNGIINAEYFSFI